MARPSGNRAVSIAEEAMMSHKLQVRFTRVLSLAAAVVLLPLTLDAQDNPYRQVPGWPQLPSSITFGGVISVDADARGNVWVFHRNQPPILNLDSSGKLLKSFGQDMFVQPHGMTIDPEGNLWVTDAQGKDGKGHQVFKFSRDGKVLMRLGKAGVQGEGPDTFSGPTDVVVAANGDIFVTDGHVAKSNGRVVKFSKDGTFIKAWGRTGTGPGEFDVPHSIAIDSRGRLFVADRSNNRIQIFDQQGRFIDQWKQFGRPSGVFVDGKDTIYVVDSQSNATQNPGFTRGIRIGSARDGKVTAFIPDNQPDADKNNNAGKEGVAADAAGNVFAGEVTGQALKKYVKK
jgi:secreted PhoX family phosphatase